MRASTSATTLSTRSTVHSKFQIPDLRPMWPTLRLLIQEQSAIVPFWSKHGTPTARNMVRRVLRNPTHPLGMTTKQIYDKIHESYPDAKSRAAAPPPFVVQPTMKGKYGRRPVPMPEPPHREHPIRSIKCASLQLWLVFSVIDYLRYLKKVVMEEMVREGEVKKIPVDRSELPDEDSLPQPPHMGRRRKKPAQNPNVFLWTLITPNSPQPSVPVVEPIPEESRSKQ